MPFFAGSMAFVGTELGHVFALDMAAQRVRWVYKLGNNMLNSPCVAKRGQLLVSSVDGELALLASH
jgi:outer membrane protein assembly factor BamB